jgi:hypothetical protein
MKKQLKAAMTPEQLVEQAFALFAPDEANWEQYKTRRARLLSLIHSYGAAQAKEAREGAAAQLERRATEIEDGQDAASLSAWVARIFRDEARTIRKQE